MGWSKERVRGRVDGSEKKEYFSSMARSCCPCVEFKLY